jgi:DNA-binding transcriptional LysR family regulator
MVDWNDLRYFLAVHRAGNLARAASELAINATTVGRRLSALEDQLGTKLFDRTPDGYQLTPAGRDLLPRAETMEREALAVDREVTGADDRLAGRVRVTATEMLATRFVAPHIWRLQAAHPEIILDLHCTNEVVSLARREADIALRLARPREDNVVTRRLSDIPLALYASARYLEARGTPDDPETSLAGHAVLLFADSRHFRLENDWLLPRAAGADVPLQSDSVSAIYAACVAGLGIALLPVMVAGVDDRLTRIETASGPERRVIWQTVHRDLRSTARIRAVMEFLERILRPPDAA